MTMRMIGAAIAAFSLVVSSACATEAVWNVDGDQNYYWSTLSNWLVDGQVPAQAPVSDVDIIFPRVPSHWHQYVQARSGESVGDILQLDLGKVTGDTSHYIVNGAPWQSGVSNPRRPITVEDPNDFTGFWSTQNTQMRWIFPASATFTPVVHNIDVQGRPSLEFPGEGKAKVEAAYNSGALVKRGAAELELGGTQGAGTHVFVEEGALTLAGFAADDTVEDVLNGAYLHLDASDTSTFGYLPGSSTHVTNWYDVRGRSYPSAHAPGGTETFHGESTPWIAAETSPTGLPLLDFGSCVEAGKDPQLGPVHTYMQFDRVTNGAEVFVVARYHEKGAFEHGAAVLGDTSLAPLQPNSGFLLGGSANASFRTGSIFRDGVAVRSKLYPSDGLTNLTVLSFGTATNAAFSTIASDQRNENRTGGMLIGEVLIFTNALSGVDRLRINDCLVRKWLTGENDVRAAAAGLVRMGVGATSVGVPANKTAQVIALQAANGTVVKTGAGTLMVDALYPTNAIIDVRGGSVALKRLVSAPAKTLASNPLIRLDASCTTSVQTNYDVTYQKGFVTSWDDKRSGVSLSAVPFSKQSVPNRPTVAAGVAPTGLDVVDFGNGGTSYAALTLPWYKQAGRVYAGFIVMRQCDAMRTFVPFFGSNDMSTDREYDTHKRILNATYPQPAALSALWTVNGEPVEPTQEMGAYFGSGAPFVVVAFLAKEPLNVSAIALGRDEPGRTGGIQVGEFVLYDRPLTYKEQRDTEAYLMDKWLGKAHPLAAAPAPGYSFASDVDAVLDASDDLTVSSLAGGTGDVVKRGAGTVTLGDAVDVSAIRSLTVEEGEIVLGIRSFLDEALYHFDASDASTYETAAGGRVDLWHDVRGNGVYATNSVLSDKGNPSLQQVEVASGVTRPMISFGLRNWGGSMFFSRNFSTLREEYAFSKGADDGFLPFCWSKDNPQDPSTSNYNDYYRSGSVVLNASSSAETLRSGRIWINGAEKAYSDTVDAKVAALWGFSHTGDTHVNALGLDRGSPNGGYIGEQIAFARQLTPVERNYLQQHLLYKWLGQGTDVAWTNAALSAVSVARGAAVTMMGAADPFVAELAGAGQISASLVQGVRAVRVAAADAAEGAYLTVSGKVSFGDAVTVSLVGTGKVFAQPGEYTLLEAVGGFENADGARWTLDAGDLETSRVYRLRVRQDKLVLEVQTKGLLLIVR